MQQWQRTGHGCDFTAAWPRQVTDLLRSSLLPAPFPAPGSYKVIATGQAVAIHPSSVLCGKKAECIVFNELVRVGWPRPVGCILFLCLADIWQPSASCSTSW